MTSLVTNVRKRDRASVFIIALSVVWFLFEFSYSTPLILGISSQYTCIGIGGWPCGYTGPYTGDYYAGYATLGCTPIDSNSTCVVPQIAMVSSFLVINNTSYVVDWANQSFQSNNQLSDGGRISVSGELTPIFYNRTAGSTFIIYHSNAKGLWNPQPQLDIQNATLTTQSNGSVTTRSQSISSTCTATLTFTVSGPPDGIWNLPMIPAGACYAVRNMAQQQSYVGNAHVSWIILASSVGGAVWIIFCAVMLTKIRRKEDKE